METLEKSNGLGFFDFQAALGFVVLEEASSASLGAEEDH
jgi:hypothetical protein